MNIIHLLAQHWDINLGSWLPLESEIIHETPLSIFLEFNFPTFTLCPTFSKFLRVNFHPLSNFLKALKHFHMLAFEEND